MQNPAHVNPMSWTAGVLDTAGRFRFRLRDGMPFATLVWVTCGRDVGERLTDHLGVGQWRKGKWEVSAKEQMGFLAEVIPYLRVQHMAASRVYQWRLTTPGRRSEKVIAPQVAKFRRSLVVDVGKTGTPS